MSGGAVSGTATASTVPERRWTHRCGTAVEIAIIVVIVLNVAYVMLDAEEIGHVGWDGSMDAKEPQTLDVFMDYFVVFVRSLRGSAVFVYFEGHFPACIHHQGWLPLAADCLGHSFVSAGGVLDGLLLCGVFSAALVLLRG